MASTAPVAPGFPVAPGTAPSVPKNLKITREALNKASQNNVYVRVGATKNNQPASVTSGRKLTSAQRIWSNEPNTVYLTDWRVTGDPQSVRYALQVFGVPPADIEASLAKAITSTSLGQIVNGQATSGTLQAELFNNEVNRYLQAKQAAGTKPKAEQFTLDNLLWFADHVKDARSVTRSATGVVTGGAVGGRGGARKDLAATLQGLQAGQVVDVSNYLANKTKRVRAAPQQGGKSKIRWLTQGPLSGLASNNIEAFTAAVRDLPGGEAQYGQYISQLRQLYPNNMGQQAVPPATLAAPPVFQQAPFTGFVPSAAPVAPPTFQAPQSFQPPQSFVAPPSLAQANFGAASRVPSPAGSRAPSPPRAVSPSSAFPIPTFQGAGVPLSGPPGMPSVPQLGAIYRAPQAF